MSHPPSGVPSPDSGTPDAQVRVPSPPGLSRSNDAISRLQHWDVPTSLSALRDEYLRFLHDRGTDALDRDGGEEHVTASCFIFDPSLTHVVLCFHRKGQFWVQVGGHIEAADDDIMAAALREAQEESGLFGLELVDGIVDIDRHQLGTAFGRCRTHWDIGVAALSPLVAPLASDESERVQWFRVDALPSPLASSVARRIAVMLSQLDRVRDPCRP